MSDQIWSRQFYKALEAVGKLTEVEKVRLANILIVVSDVKKGGRLILNTRFHLHQNLQKQGILKVTD